VKVLVEVNVGTNVGIIFDGATSSTIVNVGDAISVVPTVVGAIEGFAPQPVIIAAPVEISINNSVRFIIYSRPQV
jgi:hypothetical protein